MELSKTIAMGCEQFIVETNVGDLFRKLSAFSTRASSNPDYSPVHLPFSHCQHSQLIMMKTLNYYRFHIAIGAAVFVMNSTNLEAASFTGLGDLSGGIFESQAADISADGATVVGTSRSVSGLEAFRWTAASGMLGLGDLAGGIFQSYGGAVSADGSTIVGESSSGTYHEAFIWTLGGGMVGLGDLAGGRFHSSALAVSANGTAIVGYGSVNVSPDGNTSEGFKWIASGGITGLGDLTGGSYYSAAKGISADGSVIVGTSQSSFGLSVFRYTTAGGIVRLGSYAWSDALGISADGSTIFGLADFGRGNEAFRYTNVGGFVGIGDLPGGAFDSATQDASSDGSVLVGRATSSLGYEAFIWTGASGNAVFEKRPHRKWNYRLGIVGTY